MGQPDQVGNAYPGLAMEAARTRQLGRYPARGRLIFILLSLVLGSLLVALDTTIVSVAIPKISTDFGGLDDVGWYGSAYLATLTAFQPTSGNAFKVFNPKATYITFMVLFEGK